MIEDFIKLVTQIFPSISPYIAQQAMNSVKDFLRRGQEIQMLEPEPFEDLAQGDVISNLYFTFIDNNANEIELNTMGMLLSNTCDAHNRNQILFAPLIHLEEIGRAGIDIGALKRNLIYRIFYINSKPLADFVIDFSIVSSYSRELIWKMQRKGHIHKVSSLSRFGFYFLIAKLNVFLLRPEDPDFNKGRSV